MAFHKPSLMRRRYGRTFGDHQSCDWNKPLGICSKRVASWWRLLFLGAILFLNPTFFERWVASRWQRAAFTIAILTTATALAVGRDHYRPAQLAGALAAISGAWLVFAAMKRWGNKPHNTVKLLVDASLTIYLLHHPIIVALGIVTAKTSFSPFAEWLGVMFATYALSLGGYMLISRVPFLFFFQWSTTFEHARSPFSKHRDG